MTYRNRNRNANHDNTTRDFANMKYYFNVCNAMKVFPKCHAVKTKKLQNKL